ncbi:hypothetical protein HNR39_001818 [Glaciimonas immobilis]|uniref:Uncharacterized protein n=1 Tax=Glaciimonas immobilis TaxID=728004 RepID=A0A840RSQ2_9BURK|nr:hypothetical protein [Glaciimonas immobilis]
MVFLKIGEDSVCHRCDWGGMQKKYVKKERVGNRLDMHYKITWVFGGLQYRAPVCGQRPKARPFGCIR